MDQVEPGDIGYDRELSQLRGRFFGQRKATVKDNDDPEKRGRLRLWVPDLMTGSEDAEEQWTDWAAPGAVMGGGSGDTGGIVVPAVGSTVWVTFEQGSPDFPVWGGGYFADQVPELAQGEDDGSAEGNKTVAGVTIPGSDAGSSTYPFNRMFKLANGTIVELDETSGANRVRIRHPSGSFIEMQHDGTVTMQAVGGDLAGYGANVLMAAAASMSLAVASELKLGGSSAMDGLVKGTTWKAALDTWLAAMSTFLTALTSVSLSFPAINAAAVTMASANTTYIAAIGGIISTKVKTE